MFVQQAAWILLLSFATAVDLPAHGGQYRGPGDVKAASSSAGSSGASAGGSSSATGADPSSSSPSVASATSGSASGSSGTTARGAPIDDDLTRWEFWWEFGKDPFLRLRDVVDAGRRIVGAEDAVLNPRFHHRRGSIERPTDDDLQQTADALVRVLRSATDRDTISSCLVALGKIARDGADWTLIDTIQPFLARNDQEQRETAALALGIARRGDDASLELLADLARDTESGRRLSGLAAVNERTRAFAAFGLGLQLQRLDRPAAVFRTVEVLRTLALDRSLGWNLRVAAIEALGLFPTGLPGVGPRALRDAIVDELGAYFRLEVGPGEQLVQAHVPTVIARLVEPGSPAGARWRTAFAEELSRGIDVAGPPDPHGKQNPHIAQSCALALGSLCQPWDAAAAGDAATCELLLRAYARHRDHQTRSFALLSLARIGGAVAAGRLLEQMSHASPAIELPWCAMALGVLSARDLRHAAAAGAPLEVDARITAALRQAFRAARTPAAIGALGIALGLAQDVDSAAALRAALVENAHRDDLAGYLALGLGLMGDLDAVGTVRELVATSTRRPLVLQQCVRALGLLGDHTVGDELCRQLQSPDPSLVRLSAIAGALGRIGDRRSLQPLRTMLQDQRLTPLTRAFAAVALGMVCDGEEVPWNAPYATSANYRATTETLTDGAAGILDIL